MAGTQVPRDPNMSAEVRRFLDDLSRRQETANIFYSLTATESTALLDVFTSALKGLVPASGGGTANFLRADGTFAVPPGTSTGLTFVNTVVTTSGATQSITGLPSAKRFILDFCGISHNSGGNQSFQVALSVNNGSSYGTPRDITSVLGAGVLAFGVASVGRADSGASHPVIGINNAGAIDTTSGAINALQFSPSGGSFDAGAIDVYAQN